MDNIDTYKDQIYKTAARAWKKHLGNIGEEGVSKLIDSGIFNRGKELQGLKKGTNRILGKNNAKMYRDPRIPAALITKGQSKLFTDKFGFTATPGDLAASMKSIMEEAGPAFGDGALSPHSGLLDGLTMVNKNQNKRLYDYAGKNVGKIPRKDRESKKWLQAIIERHEADEIRMGKKILANKNKVTNPTIFQLTPDKMTGFYSHVSPKVMAAESANIALAPNKTKKYMENLRNFSLDKATGRGSETIDLKKLTGIDYGKSGVYNRAGANKGERKVVSQFKQDNPLWNF